MNQPAAPARAAPIVCGFDFSAAADDAADVAADLAARTGDRLVLVHATPAAGDADSRAVVRRVLDEARARLAHRGVGVDAVLEHAAPDALLAQVAGAQGARLVVMADGGGPRSAGGRPRSGRLARALVGSCTAPVLIVHDATVLERWLRGGRPLRALVAVTFDDAPPALRATVADLRRAGAVDVIVDHVSFPPEEHQRLGAGPPAHLIENDPAVEAMVRAELWEQWKDLPGDGLVSVRVTNGLGRVDAHIHSAAVDAGADVIVIAGHQRHGLERLLHGAADKGVLSLAHTNVLVVPVPR